MQTIHQCTLPDLALSASYGKSGAYADCYYIDLAHEITLSDYVYAFYTTPLFRIERFLLRWLARRPSTEHDAEQLALNQTRQFAIWDVEQRNARQILLRDATRRTRSWLMVEALNTQQHHTTRLYFGSVVVPKSRAADGSASFGFVFHLLSGFHHIYSKALLRAAQTRLSRLRKDVEA
ncbi:hypothetical protein [Undibacterium curvum]|uniref:DUF2867 domain-containing protein n=1 Tax=Undibacterium curvum TaxID=2762294 RepID=A0ABR7A0B8_9BURK|nr:hypothetical protein [Undibacterium curvum]MBC3930147.1 hypothetical protein [Undibacterium curvum]